MEEKEHGNRSPQRKLIRMAPILDIVQTVLWTGKLENESPVSVCLVAEQQSAKSSAMIRYGETPTVKMYSDITSKPLFDLTRDIKDGKMRHLMLLDLHTVVSHNRYTVDRTLNTMAALMEEGLGTVADAGGTISIPDLPKIGVIMAVTPDFFESKRGWWRKTGFLSRFLTINYQHSEDTRLRVHCHIRDGGLSPLQGAVKLPEKPVRISLRPIDTQTLQDMARQWGELEGDPAYRYHKQLRRLVMARALMNNRRQTNDSDIATVTTWTPFFRPSQAATI